jgi:hypothetical protein
MIDDVQKRAARNLTAALAACLLTQSCGNVKNAQCLELTKQSNSYNPGCRTKLDAAIADTKKGKYIKIEELGFVKGQSCSLKDIYDVGVEKHKLDIMFCDKNSLGEIFSIKLIFDDFKPNGEKAAWLMGEIGFQFQISKSSQIDHIIIGINK